MMMSGGGCIQFQQQQEEECLHGEIEDAGGKNIDACLDFCSCNEIITSGAACGCVDIINNAENSNE